MSIVTYLVDKNLPTKPERLYVIIFDVALGSSILSSPLYTLDIMYAVVAKHIVSAC